MANPKRGMKPETLVKYEKLKKLVRDNPDIPVTHLCRRVRLTPGIYRELKGKEEME